MQLNRTKKTHPILADPPRFIPAPTPCPPKYGDPEPHVGSATVAADSSSDDLTSLSPELLQSFEPRPPAPLCGGGWEKEGREVGTLFSGAGGAEEEGDARRSREAVVVTSKGGGSSNSREAIPTILGRVPVLASSPGSSHLALLLSSGEEEEGKVQEREEVWRLPPGRSHGGLRLEQEG